MPAKSCTHGARRIRIDTPLPTMGSDEPRSAIAVRQSQLLQNKSPGSRVSSPLADVRGENSAISSARSAD